MIITGHILCLMLEMFYLIYSCLILRFGTQWDLTLEMQIMEYDGNADRKFIHEAVKRKPSMDALKLRRYILDNEPGMDFNVEIKRPESLGGGSFTTFLEWDDTIFFNIA